MDVACIFFLIRLAQRLEAVVYAGFNFCRERDKERAGRRQRSKRGMRIRATSSNAANWAEMIERGIYRRAVRFPVEEVEKDEGTVASIAWHMV